MFYFLEVMIELDDKTVFNTWHHMSNVHWKTTAFITIFFPWRKWVYLSENVHRDNHDWFYVQIQG